MRRRPVPRSAARAGTDATRRGRIRGALVAVLLPLLAATVLGASAPPSTPLPGAAYVALGDSYAAGYGLPDPTGRPITACGQSARDYPHRVAAQLGLRLTDRSCATATTADLRARSAAGAPAQLAALGPGTRLVTITIGGNDSGLFSQAFSCLALTADGPVIAGQDVKDCRSRFVRDGVDRLQQEITGGIARDLTGAFAAVRAAAPSADVVVVGYPAIFPDPAHTPPTGCFRPAITASSLTGTYPENSFPFTDVDVRYFFTVQQELDAATRSAATAQGATYVSMLERTVAHSACATTAPYVNGLQLSSPEDVQHVDLAPGALHPNDAGTAATASAAVAAVRALDAQRASPAPDRTTHPRATAPGASGPALAIGAGVLVVAAVGIAIGVARRGRSRGRDGSGG